MSPRPIPRRLAACGASLLIGTALCASLSTPVSATAASGDLQPVARGDAACTPVAMRGKTYIHPDGSAAQAGDPSAATVYHPDFGPGSDVTQIVPPRNFRPVDATDDLLTRYNLATRPKAPEARAHWQKTMANFKGTTTPGLCATTHRSLLSQGTSTDRIWSGPLVTDPSSAVTEVIGTWHQTGFDASCPSASAYSTWPGIGGYGTGDLLQSGTDVDQSNLNATYAWWEALSHTGAFVYETKFPGFTINPGQVVSTSTQYVPGGYGKAIFNAYNGTTGYSAPGVSFTSLQGQPAVYYYDGSTAEFINERPTKSDGLPFQLRKPHYNNTAWTDNSITYGARHQNGTVAGAAYSGTVLLSDTNLKMTRAGNTSDPVLDDMRHGVASNNTWTNYWDACN